MDEGMTEGGYLVGWKKSAIWFAIRFLLGKCLDILIRVHFPEMRGIYVQYNNSSSA